MFETLITMIVSVSIIAISSLFFYKLIQKFWIEAKPNEWLIVIRNGEMSKGAIGLGTWVLPSDQTVKFGSRITQVNFSAEQVTAEMQGVQVTGMMIWSIYRKEDGPFRAYRNFGNDLMNENPKIANSKLENMAVSIIRDRIANLTIDDVLRNRSKIRDGVKEEMQKIITGWGIWLETCEILDVKIASKNLFSNLQTEFREKARLDADKIAQATESIIQADRLQRQQETSKKQAMAEAEQKIFANQKKLEVQEQDQKVYEQSNLIQQRKIEADNQKYIKEAQLRNNLKLKNQELEEANRLQQIELDTKRVEEMKKLQQAEYLLKKEQIEQQLSLKNLDKKQELEYMKEHLQIQGEYYTPNVLKAKLLDTTKDIYKSLKISEMKVVNVGNGTNSGHQDVAGQLIGQMVSTYKAVSQGFDNKE